jgi:hypothetical protein
VEPIKYRSGPLSQTGICCDILAHSSLCLTAAMFPSARRPPDAGGSAQLPPNFLKHADEQTVAGLAAVGHAIADFALARVPFRDWGIVAAPCFLGRATLARALEEFAREGPWGLSPHFIPHRSQHAVSGTISLALKIHGPNFGTGGGPTSVGEGLMAAAVLLSDHRLPGLWLVLTGWDPELIPNKDGTPSSGNACMAVALALTGHRPGSSKPRLRVAAAPDSEPAHCKPAEPTLADFTRVVSQLPFSQGGGIAVAWRCSGGGWIEIRSGHRESLLPKPHSLQRLTGKTAAHCQGAGTERKQ